MKNLANETLKYRKPYVPLMTANSTECIIHKFSRAHGSKTLTFTY